MTSSCGWMIHRHAHLPLEWAMRLHAQAAHPSGPWVLYETYPFSIHNLLSRFKLGYKRVFVDDNGNIRRVQSNACTRAFIISATAVTCSTSQVLVPLVESVRAGAKVHQSGFITPSWATTNLSERRDHWKEFEEGKALGTVIYDENVLHLVVELISSTILKLRLTTQYVGYWYNSIIQEANRSVITAFWVVVCVGRGAGQLQSCSAVEPTPGTHRSTMAPLAKEDVGSFSELGEWS